MYSNKQQAHRHSGVPVSLQLHVGRNQQNRYHMTRLRAALVTPLTGSLAPFGYASAVGLTLWARYVAHLPSPWDGGELPVQETPTDPAEAMHEAIATHPAVLFGPYGS